MTRDYWGSPYDGARHPDRGDYRDLVDPIERAERTDAPSSRERAVRKPDDEN